MMCQADIDGANAIEAPPGPPPAFCITPPRIMPLTHTLPLTPVSSLSPLPYHACHPPLPVLAPHVLSLAAQVGMKPAALPSPRPLHPQALLPDAFPVLPPPCPPPPAPHPLPRAALPLLSHCPTPPFLSWQEVCSYPAPHCYENTLYAAGHHLGMQCIRDQQ